MKMNYHILFLIVIIGIISVGVVGANVFNSDSSMKKEVFDGITVSVPTDSEFVKTGENVYKDTNYGIQINTFKNNNSMIKYLKNSKKSKIIPVENQPPQSVAFKKGQSFNILVTNGIEGVAVGSKDKELTSKIANKVTFSNNHHSEKPAGVPFIRQPMTVEKDYDLIMLLVGEVDNKVFNTLILDNILLNVTASYNENIYKPIDNMGVDDSSDGSGTYVSDIKNEDDLKDALSDANTSSNDNSVDSNSEDISNSQDNLVQSSDNNHKTQKTQSGNPSNSVSSSNQQGNLSLSECEQLVHEQILVNNPDLRIGEYYNVSNGYVFIIVDNLNETVNQVTVNALTGEITPISS